MFLALTACNNKSALATHVQPIDAAALRQMSEMRVLWGHQSVGRNIIAGLRDISSDAKVELPIERLDQGNADFHGIAEFDVGRNGDPASKDREFLSGLRQGFGERGGVALYKYCFVDMEKATDPEKLFQQYKNTLSEARKEFPRVTVIPVTMPVTTIEPTWKLIAKRVLNKTTDAELNRKRMQFNEAVRKEYAGGPIFDLARAEATLPDGERNIVIVEGAPTEVLAAEYAADGAHLNGFGRRQVAAELLRTLQQIKVRNE